MTERTNKIKNMIINNIEQHPAAQNTCQRQIQMWSNQFHYRMKKIVVLFLLAMTIIPVSSQEIYTLDKCKELSLQNNAKAKNSQLAVEAAEQTKKMAFTKYFPSISAMGVGFEANKPMMSMSLDISSMLQPMMSAITPIVSWLMQQGVPIDLSSLNLQSPKIEALKKGMIGAVTATQPVFAGGQIYNGNRLAKLGVQVAELQKTMSEDDILLTVEQDYWQILALTDNAKTIAESENLLNRALKDVTNAVEAGVTNRNDLLKVELKLNELQSNKLQVANGLQISKMVLAQFIGIDNYNFQIDTTLSQNLPQPIEVQVDHRSALAQRPEYRLLDKNIEANKLQVKMKTGENLPTVAVGAGWNYMNFDKGGTMPIDNNFGMVFATVSLPISDWWGGSHAIKQQKLQVQIAENDKRNAEELLLIQMQQLFNELQEAYLQIQLAQKTIDTALENVRLNEDYYHAGTGILTDLLDAQTSLQQARDQYTQAVTDYHIKLSQYKQATFQ